MKKSKQLTERLWKSRQKNAFREALVNSIIHRAWDVKACINVAMFEDRIELTSPGGLLQGLDENEYLKGGVSILRNRILGSIFYRLHLIEHFGSGAKGSWMNTKEIW